MRNLKLLTILVFLGVIMLCVYSRDITKTTMFAKTEELAVTTASVSENEVYGSAEGVPADFSNEQAEITFLGRSRLTYTTEDGKEISAAFDYGFRRYPDNGIVTVMYDKAHPKKVSLNGFDHPDRGTSARMLLMAILLAGADVVLMLLVFFGGLAMEHRIYKKEQNIYGKDISGYKAVFWFKIITMLAFAAGVSLFAYSAYNIGKDLNELPAANDSLCGFADAYVADNGDGTYSYSFTAQNGQQVTKQMNFTETLLENDGVLKVRYLLSDPQQSYSDNMAVYLIEGSSVKHSVVLGSILLAFVPFLFVVTVVLEAYNKRSNQKRGYVHYFRSTKKDLDFLNMDDDEYKT